ncbi:MAG: tetratricopeptide repeat protein [Bacteroidota bacterium]
MKGLFQLAALILCVQIVYAQKSTHPDATNCDEKGYCWGDKREEGKVKFAVYSDNYNFGDYAWKDAEPALDWLITNIPYLTKSIYINGYKIYDFLEKNAESEEKKIEYQDKLLSLLDKRITYFGEEKKVSHRKGVKAYPYLIKRGKENYDSLFELYKKIFELNGKNTSRGNITYLMAMVKTQYSRKKIDEDIFLGYLDKAGSIIEQKMAEADGKEKAKLATTLEQVEGMIPIELLQCNMIEERMGKKLLEEPENYDLAKKVLKYLVIGKCYDSPIFLTAAEAVFEKEPTASMASIIAKKYIASKDYDIALEWYDKGIDIAGEDNEKKGEFYFEKAQIYSMKGRLSDARSAAIKSAEVNKENTSKAYILVGDLYMSSGNVCSDANPLKYRAIYLAAYDAYARAGASSKMNNAKAQFPSMEEIFTAGKQIGDPIEVGCWIGGKTELRKRP